MSLTMEERNALVTIRLQRAKETLQDARDIAKMQIWRAATNRLYYACYYAVSALLLRYGHSVRTHSGIISLLGLHFVSKGLLSDKSGKFYSKLFELRQTGDYDDWVVIDAEDVQSQIVPAEEFIASVENLIEQKNLCTS